MASTLAPGTCPNGTNAVLLDGDNDYIRVPPLQADGKPTAFLTIEAWVRLDGAKASMALMSHGDGDAPGDFALLAQADGSLVLEVAGAGSASFGSIGTRGRWTYLALVLRPTNATLFVRGLELATVSLGPRALTGFGTAKVREETLTMVLGAPLRVAQDAVNNDALFLL